jgi:hypothetical protein
MRKTGRGCGNHSLLSHGAGVDRKSGQEAGVPHNGTPPLAELVNDDGVSWLEYRKILVPDYARAWRDTLFCYAMLFGGFAASTGKPAVEEDDRAGCRATGGGLGRLLAACAQSVRSRRRIPGWLIWRRSVYEVHGLRRSDQRNRTTYWRAARTMFRTGGRRMIR